MQFQAMQLLLDVTLDCVPEDPSDGGPSGMGSRSSTSCDPELCGESDMPPVCSNSYAGSIPESCAA